MSEAVPWKPIDSAPQDEDILVFTKTWGPIIVRHSSEYGEWLSRMQVPVSIKEEDDLPTHWMELPGPPAGTADDGGEPAAGEVIPQA